MRKKANMITNIEELETKVFSLENGCKNITISRGKRRQKSRQEPKRVGERNRNIMREAKRPF